MAVIVAVVLVATGLVAIEKTRLVLLTGIVIEAGGTAAGLLDVRVTTAPPVGAGLGITTSLPVVGVPPTVEVGYRAR